MNQFYKIILLVFIFPVFANAQGGAPSCAELQANFQQYQSCATNIPFQNSTGNTSGETFFQQTSCIETNFQGPTWFFIKIQGSGDITLEISQVDNNGDGTDVDYAIWGPFANMDNICGLLSEPKEVDCSYLPDAIEEVEINNAQAGEYYILLVDNYSNVPGEITISQIDGLGSSDCSFLSSVEIVDTGGNEITQLNYCKPATKDLVASVDVTDFEGNVADLRFNYRWYKDGILVTSFIDSTASTNTLNVDETGIYKVELTAYDSTDPTVVIADLPVSEAEISLNFYDTPSLNTTPVTLKQCDYLAPNTDGIAVVNLTEVYDAITNGDNLIGLRYFLDGTLTQEILTPEVYTNGSPFNQTIYVTGFYAGQPLLCPSNVASIALEVNPTSVTNYPNIAPICPELNSTFGFVDFDSQRILIKNLFFPLTNVTISFYRNTTDAAVEENELTNASQMPIGISTIFARIETNNNCEGIGTFDVEIFAAPLQNTIATIQICQTENVIFANKDSEALAGQNASVQASYFISFDNARDNVAPINKNFPFTGSIGTTPIFARLFDIVTQCFSIVNFNLIVLPNPTINQPSPMSVCGATTADFNLENRSIEITGNNTNYQVFFYETPADLAADNSIPDPTNYSSSTKTIYVKVIDPTNNNCGATTTLDLNVNENPGSATNPILLEGCEDSGFYTFDLTEREFPMLGNTPSDELKFDYYIDLTDAESHNGNFITTPEAFINTSINYQKIYVRITSTVNFDSETQLPCYRILEQELFVRPFPRNLLEDRPYYICIDSNDNVVTEASIDTGLPLSDFYFVWYTGFDAVAQNQILGANESVFSTAIEGDFSVRIMDITNHALCTTVANFSTKKTLIPFSIEGNPTELVAFEVDNIITAIATPQSSDFEYQLNDNGWQEDNVFYDVSEGIYHLRVRNRFGCGEISTMVVVVDYPRFFTPNGDGFNDLWNIGGRVGLDISNVYIFDKFGKLVKEIVKDEQGWDGALNGNPLPADDYWFRIDFAKGGLKSEFLSHFSLKR